MQPFSRQVARTLNGAGRLPLELPARRHKIFARINAVAKTRSVCVQCGIRDFVPSRRFYSSEVPPKDPKVHTSPTVDSHASHDLPSAKEHRRGNLNQKLSHVMDNVQSRLVNASHTLNDLTGYSEIEGIKAENRAIETALAKSHTDVRTARQAYKSSNTKRANTQREVTTLLARKDSWSPVDLERFTELYRTDHVLEGEVAKAQEALTESEAEEQKLSQRLNAGILRRYHEEQIWSDRIRRASTWGTWGLMGMNFILFVVLQFVAEPWRRRRLVRGVVEEEKGVLEEVRGELAAVKAELKATAAAVTSASQPIEQSPSTQLDGPGQTPVISGPWREIVVDPAKWRLVAEDFFSERRVDLRMRDASILALQGAVAGAAIVGGTMLIMVRRP